MKKTSFVPLIQVWRKKYEALVCFLNSQHSKDKALYEECEQRWTKHVRVAAKNQKINTLIDSQPFSNQKEKSYCVRDALNVCGEWDNATIVTRLWGISVTGSVGQLFAAARSGDEFSRCLSDLIGSPVAFVGALPAHIGCLLSPQAVADISMFSDKIFKDGNLVADQLSALNKQLEPYLFQTHCDLEKIATHGDSVMGTMVLTFISQEDKKPVNPLFVGRYSADKIALWSDFVGQWKTTSTCEQLFFSRPEQWSRALVLALSNLTDFTWAMNARVDGHLDKVLDIDRIWVEYQDNQIVLDAFTPIGFYAQATLPVETTVWPFHSLIGNWEDRNIVLHQKEKS